MPPSWTGGLNPFVKNKSNERTSIYNIAALCLNDLEAPATTACLLQMLPRLCTNSTPTFSASLTRKNKEGDELKTPRAVEGPCPSTVKPGR